MLSSSPIGGTNTVLLLPLFRALPSLRRLAAPALSMVRMLAARAARVLVRVVRTSGR
jgi:hypothetical protein